MEQWLLWLIGGFVLVIAEVVTGTFYLLVIGIGAFVAALVAWLTGNELVQAVLGGAVAIGGVVFVHHWHARNRGGKPGEGNFLDRGQGVVLEGWTDEAAGIARVKYRGSSWDARLARGEDHPRPGRHPLHRRAGRQHARRRGRSARRLSLDNTVAITKGRNSNVRENHHRRDPHDRGGNAHPQHHRHDRDLRRRDARRPALRGRAHRAAAERLGVERLGKFHRVLEPGLKLIMPFVDRVAYKHSLKEVPLDVPEQVCITKDNTQLAVDGIIYFQVVDPRLASYGTSNYVLAISQLAQTALRSEIGKMELDKTFESRDEINHKVVEVLDEAGRTWGIKVLSYEIKSLTPPESILRAMQAQITAEREKRAVIATSEGKRQQEINIADGERQAAILESEGQKQAQINKAAGRGRGDRAGRRRHRERGARGGRGDGSARRHERGEPEGGRPVHRGVRQPRQGRQHAHHSGRPFRHRGPRLQRDDGARPHEARTGRGHEVRIRPRLSAGGRAAVHPMR